MPVGTPVNAHSPFARGALTEAKKKLLRFSQRSTSIGKVGNENTPLRNGAVYEARRASVQNIMTMKTANHMVSLGAREPIEIKLVWKDAETGGHGGCS